MKSVAFETFGTPEALKIIPRPLPEAGPGQVVVKVKGAAVNPTDILMLTGKQTALMTGLTPPYVAGMEFSGHIAAVGEGVDLAVGVPVMGICNPRRPEGGGHSQYVVVPRASVAVLAEGVDVLTAGAIPMNYVTAMMALEIVGLKAGQSLLVTGGTGILGGAVLGLARAAGLVVVAGGKSQDSDELKALGAEHIVPRHEGLVEAVHALLPQGVDAMIDAALIGTSVSQAVRDGGTAVSVRMMNPVEDARLNCDYVSVVKGLERQDLLQKLADLLASGQIKPRIAEDGILPFTQAQQAFSRTIAGGFRGRIVLSFDA